MSDNSAHTEQAYEKISQLLTCGNERVELAAAKELLGIIEKESDDSVSLEVTIKIVE